MKYQDCTHGIRQVRGYIRETCFSSGANCGLGRKIGRAHV